MNEVQDNLYKLLESVDKICKVYDIEYSLAYGTALGAVRHNQFIPWDDDIDLFITRDNWNKFRDIVENEDNVLPDNHSLVYNENTVYYCNSLPRYVDKNTTFIYKSQVLPGKACGNLIEFFILDPMPKDEEKRQEFIDLFQVYLELLSPYFVVCKNLSSEDWQRHCNLYKNYCDRIDNEGEEKIIRELENQLQHFPEDDCDQYILRWGVFTQVFDKSYFENYRSIQFENIKVPISKFSESIFRSFYGDDWMYVPELPNHKIHNAFQNVKIPFQEYTDCYMEKINRKKVFEKYKNNKRNNVSLFYNRRKVDMIVAKTKVNVESKHICKDLNNKEDYLRLLLKNRDYDLIIKEFNEYISLQLLKDVKKYNIFVHISDKNLSTLLSCLIEQGKFYDADKFLKIRESQKNALNDDLNEIKRIIGVCRELSIAHYDRKDLNLVQSLIDKYENEYPNLLDIHRAKLLIKESNAETCEDFKSIDEYCDEILKSYPFDGETMAFQARAKLECGHKQEAMELYKKSVKNTRNGLIWKKVEDEIGISRIEYERELMEG